MEDVKSPRRTSLQFCLSPLKLLVLLGHWIAPLSNCNLVISYIFLLTYHHPVITLFVLAGKKVLPYIII
jgi:hypothetical protein